VAKNKNIFTDDFKEVPEAMPVIPLTGTVLYPFMVVPLFVQGPKNEKAIDVSVAGEHFVFVATNKQFESSSGDADDQAGDESAVSEPSPENFNAVGTVASVLRMMRIPTGGIKIMVQGLFRGRAQEIALKPDGYIEAKVELLEETNVEITAPIEALMRTVRDQLERAAKLGKSLPQEFLAMIKTMKEPGKLADLASSTIDMEPGDAQNVLEQLDPEKRLIFVSRLISRELDILEIQNKIKSNVQTVIEDSQRKYFLREQLKAIQKELGQQDPQASEIEELRKLVSDSKMPEQANKQALAEIDRLQRMHPDAAEANVIRTYIDWMTAMPWNKSSKDRLDLDLARRVLDEDHYGLDKIKTRIIETLAVRKLNPKARSPIICFVGPPGVGKTSLGQSIARALDRKFIRLSVGGVRDEAEIRGHRRTYVGAMPGRIINGVKNCGYNNPVFMIDEVDKIGMDYRGDPASALLEVLDPEQNANFTDHYLDVAFDLSNIMFITTANVLETIPGPLRDRMEVISLAGYTEQEKLSIAMKYLIPRQIRETGLSPKNVKFGKSAVSAVISGYTREAGVRNLERELGAVCRKVAAEVARGPKRNKTYKITSSEIVKYLGAAKSYQQHIRHKDRIGVVNGLAWTPTGGEVLVIEAVLMEGKGQLILTGQLGDVMKESAQTALSYVRSKCNEKDCAVLWNEKLDVHIHVPAGAVPKDGPSAGVAMTTALMSLFVNRPVRGNVAMTGEISLTGDVLPIGGLKQKLLAAKREGMKEVLVPLSNRSDIEDLKKEDIEGLRIIYIQNADELAGHVFRNAAEVKRKPGKRTVIYRAKKGKGKSNGKVPRAAKQR